MVFHVNELYNITPITLFSCIVWIIATNFPLRKNQEIFLSCEFILIESVLSQLFRRKSSVLKLLFKTKLGTKAIVIVKFSQQMHYC